MANQAQVVIKFRTDGEKQVRRALNGILSDGAKAAQQAAKVDRQAVTESNRNARAKEAGKTRIVAAGIEARNRLAVESLRQEGASARQSVSLAAQAERSKSRESEKAARSQKKDARDAARVEQAEMRKTEQRNKQMRRSIVRETRRAYQEQERDARSAAMAERRGNQRLQRGLAVGGVAIGAAGAAAAQLVTGAQGVIGIRSQEQITSDAIGLRQRFLAQSLAAGATGEQSNAMLERAVGISESRNVSPTQVIEALIAGQEQYSVMADALQGGPQAMDNLFATIDRHALMARATGDDVASVSTAMDAFSRQFHLDTAQTHEAMGVLYQGSQDGSLGMADFANVMPEVLAPFITARGGSVSGVEGLREFAAVAQGIRASGQSPERTRVLTGALFQNLSDTNVQERLAASAADGGLGIRATDAAGNIRSPAALIAEIAARRDIDTTSTAFRSIFHGAEASAAISALVNQERAGTTLGSRQNVDAAAGNASMARVAAGMNADVSGQAMREVNRNEARGLRNAEEMIRVNIDLAHETTKLQGEFPKLTMALEALKPLATMAVMGMFARATMPGSFMSNRAPVTGPGAMAAEAAMLATRSVPSATPGVAPILINQAGGVTAGGALQALGMGYGAFTATQALLDATTGRAHGAGTASENTSEFFSNFGNWGFMDAITGNYATNAGGNRKGDRPQTMSQLNADNAKSQQAVEAQTRRLAQGLDRVVSAVENSARRTPPTGL